MWECVYSEGTTRLHEPTLLADKCVTNVSIPSADPSSARGEPDHEAKEAIRREEPSTAQNQRNRTERASLGQCTPDDGARVLRQKIMGAYGTNMKPSKSEIVRALNCNRATRDRARSPCSSESASLSFRACWDHCRAAKKFRETKIVHELVICEWYVTVVSTRQPPR